MATCCSHGCSVMTNSGWTIVAVFTTPMKARGENHSKASTVRSTHMRKTHYSPVYFSKDYSSITKKTFSHYPVAPILNGPLKIDSDPWKVTGFSRRKEGKPFLSMNSQRHTQPAGVWAKFAVRQREIRQRKFLSVYQRGRWKKIGNLKYVHIKWAWHGQRGHSGRQKYCVGAPQASVLKIKNCLLYALKILS